MYRVIRDAYGADLNFLARYVWPDISHKQMSHDSYCCEKFPNSKPFPTKRPPTYLHVGQARIQKFYDVSLRSYVRISVDDEHYNDTS